MNTIHIKEIIDIIAGYAALLMNKSQSTYMQQQVNGFF
jgi:ribosomal protein S17E